MRAPQNLSDADEIWRFEGSNSLTQKKGGAPHTLSHGATHATLGRWPASKQQAASSKQLAASSKLQAAASSKLQAGSSKSMVETGNENELYGGGNPPSV